MQVSSTILWRHLQSEPFDTAEEEYVTEMLWPAAEGFAQDFLNRRVFGTVAELEEAQLDQTAGFGAIVAPPQYIMACLLILGHLYKNREAVTDTVQFEMPMGARALLWPHRICLGV